MISREELHELVWSEPMTRIAERFGVSGSYMARICTLLNVPRPERGHWAKLEVGKASPTVPLPEARPGDPLSWSRDGEPQPRSRPREARVRIARNSVHGLIRGARGHFEHGRPVDEGAYLKPYKKLLVDVTASEACLDRALDFANDLFKGLESVGHHVVIAPADRQLGRAPIDERAVRKGQRGYYHHSGLWSPSRPTVTYVGSVAIGLAVVEMSEEVLLRYVNGRYIRDADYVAPRATRYSVDRSWTTTRKLPCGRLRLIAYSPYLAAQWSAEWEEAPGRSLRSEVRSIVDSLEKAAPEIVASVEEAERKAEIARQEWLAAEERRRREEDRRRVEQSIRDSREQLGQVIQQWANVMSVEALLAGIERRAADLPAHERDRVTERLRLARSFLGTQDPLDFFLSWKTPEERYRPAYSGDGTSG